MRYVKYVCLIFLINICWQSQILAEESYEDMLLRKIISAYQIRAYKPSPITIGPKERLGQALFFDPILSGPQDVACATCHIRSMGSGDGLPLAIGLGAKGVSEERLMKGSAFVIPRNTLPLFNRGSGDFIDFFWDGRVQMGANGIFESPLGKELPKGFDSLLAVASVFPIVEPDEMLGHSSRKVDKTVQHGDLVTLEGIDNNYQARALNVFDNIVKRLLKSNSDHAENTTNQYKILVHEAYPDVPLEEVTIAHIGNALAAYIRIAFELQSAPWDRYIEGEKNALTFEQKRGAIIFYGKGRCAVCHAGSQFSDFLFHGLSIPQLRVGKHSPYLDYGRAAASGRAEDRYAFRTPPLRNVIETGPWGHNGIFKTLLEIIKHHTNPIPLLYKAQKQDRKQGLYSGRLLASRSKTLADISTLTDEDIRLVLFFLSSLSSSTVLNSVDAVPSSVPSGNNSFIP